MPFSDADTGVDQESFTRSREEKEEMVSGQYAGVSDVGSWSPAPFDKTHVTVKVY